MAFDFPNAPTVGQAYQGYVWDGEKWVAQGGPMGAVRYDLPQGLTSAQAAQARANIWVTKKNYIINGGMQISQENGTTLGTTAGYYAVDTIQLSFAGTTGIVGAQQVASASPGGSTHRLLVSVNTIDATVGAGDIVFLQMGLEGLRVADLMYGTATAKTTILQFGVKAPAGTYSIVFTNSATNRSYVAEYVIAAGEANADVVKSVTIPGDTAGTWLKDTGAGLFIRWGLMAGATFQQAAGAWGTTNAIGSPNQFNFMAAGNTFYLFDVSLTEGTVAPPFQLPDYPTELRACMRYYIPSTGYVVDTTSAFNTAYLPVAMRVPPTITGGGAGFTVNTSSPIAISVYQTSRATQSIVLNARL